jgi:predicted phosphodiesterase
MLLGLISDIHGNLLALEAVLAELEREPLDRLVCLGDVVAGPRANEALARIRGLGCPVIMGNWDAWSIDGMPQPTSSVEEKLYAIGAYWADRLDDEDRDFIRSFVPTLELELEPEKTLLCFHGSPSSFDHWIVATTPDEEVARMLAGRKAPVMAGGHTHLQMVRRYSDSLFLNPGSVGLPFELWSPEDVRIAPRAEYALLTSADGRLAVELRRTTYDVEAHLRSGLESGMPHADWWAASWQHARMGSALSSP